MNVHYVQSGRAELLTHAVVDLEPIPVALCREQYIPGGFLVVFSPRPVHAGIGVVLRLACDRVTIAKQELLAFVMLEVVIPTYIDHGGSFSLGSCKTFAPMGKEFGPQLQPLVQLLLHQPSGVRKIAVIGLRNHLITAAAIEGPFAHVLRQPDRELVPDLPHAESVNQPEVEVGPLRDYARIVSTARWNIGDYKSIPRMVMFGHKGHLVIETQHQGQRDKTFRRVLSIFIASFGHLVNPALSNSHRNSLGYFIARRKGSVHRSSSACL